MDIVPADRLGPVEESMRLATRALEYTRVLAHPTEPLAGYVLVDGWLCASLRERIAWTEGGPHPRVLMHESDDFFSYIGWAPIRVIADALEPLAAAAAAELRSAPASDVGEWTVLHVAGRKATVLRCERDDLQKHARNVRTIPPPVDLEDRTLFKRHLPRVFTEILPGECVHGAHDGDGPPMVIFHDADLAVHARTCSVCELDHIPQAWRGPGEDDW